MDANGVAHLPRLQPALEADVPLAWQEDWDNSSRLAVEVPDTPGGWAYYDLSVARENAKDMPVMVTSVHGWTATKLSEFNLALIRTGRPCHWTRVTGQEVP